MTDRVVDYGSRSLTKYIEDSVGSFDDVKIVTPDFDWNQKPDPSRPGSLINRPLPFAAILVVSDETPPFTVGNILYEQIINCEVHVVGSSYTEMNQLTADMKQALKTAVNPITSGVGITLYNFAVASGAFFANAGTLQVEIGQTDYLNLESVDQQDNRKFRSITPVILSAFKDSTATLLENKSRISLTDS